MGIIVNAGALLKYVALAMLILAYVYDSFNNVEKKYLQLNKALFKIVMDSVKGERVEEVTSQPSELQEERGFKSQELSEQAGYEQPDDVAKELSRHWFINDLILFVDKNDVPRIPKKLFQEVCEIQVAGVPGPVHIGLFSALKSFVKIAIFVMFVFLAIVSFASAYGLSSTSQTIAALAGGSVPLLLNTFIKTPKPGVDMETVSFRNKLTEVVNNFYQFWPMNDFSFKMTKVEDSSNEDELVEWASPVADTDDCVNVSTLSHSQSIFMLGPFGRRATEKKDKGKLTKLLRREVTEREHRHKSHEEVDIMIILPKDFDDKGFKKFYAEQKSKQDD